MNSKKTTGTQKPVTLKDIALRCGVGIPTVSRALRNPNRFSQDLTKRIRETAEELGYDPLRHEGARRLVLSRFGKQTVNHVVALIAPSRFFFRSFFAHMLVGLEDVFSEKGFSLLMIDSDKLLDKQISPSFSRGEVDAAIILKDYRNSMSILRLLREEPCFGDRPVVTPLLNVPGCSTVQVDYFRGSYDSMVHLLDLGHRHVLLMTDPYDQMLKQPNDLFYQRLQGYRQAFWDRDMDPEQYLHFLPVKDRLWECLITSYETVSMEELPAYAKKRGQPLLDALKASPEITAILPPNDFGAIFTEYVLRFAGMRVPEDFSIIGFDGTDPLCDDDGQNRLTTVDLPLDEIGHTVARLIIDQIHGTAANNARIILPVTLSIRQTTAPRS
jgi:LacI family transcriptional regulator